MKNFSRPNFLANALRLPTCQEEKCSKITNVVPIIATARYPHIQPRTIRSPQSQSSPPLPPPPPPPPPPPVPGHTKPTYDLPPVTTKLKDENGDEMKKPQLNRQLAFSLNSINEHRDSTSRSSLRSSPLIDAADMGTEKDLYDIPCVSNIKETTEMKNFEIQEKKTFLDEDIITNELRSTNVSNSLYDSSLGSDTVEEYNNNNLIKQHSINDIPHQIYNKQPSSPSSLISTTTTILTKSEELSTIDYNVYSIREMATCEMNDIVERRSLDDQSQIDQISNTVISEKQDRC